MKNMNHRRNENGKRTSTAMTWTKGAAAAKAMAWTLSLLTVSTLLPVAAFAQGAAEAGTEDTASEASLYYEGDLYTGDFTEADEDTDWRDESVTTVVCEDGAASVDGSGVKADGNEIKITKAGTYVFSGTWTGQILVKAEETDDVRIVLNGMTVTGDGTPAIYAKKAASVTITLTEGTENLLTDTQEREDVDEDATLLAKCDLILNGEGTLTIQANAEEEKAIHGKGEIRILSGTYVIESVYSGIVAKTGLAIRGGSFTVETKDDALKSKAGFWIGGGTFSITAGDDAIHADEILVIDGGSIDILQSYEGLEAPVIVIDDGEISLVASDDGINAAGGELEAAASTDQQSGQPFMMGGMESTSSGYLYIHGGTIYVNAAGDGLDSNTRIAQTGGTLTVEGPEDDMNGALDYDEAYVMSGGSLLALGSSGMLQSISEARDIACLNIVFSEQQAAGTEIVLTTADGETVLKTTASKRFSSLVYADEALQTGETYTLTVDGEALTDIILDSEITTVDETGQTVNLTGFGFGSFGGFGGGQMGGQRGEMGEMGQMGQGGPGGDRQMGEMSEEGRNGFSGFPGGEGENGRPDFPAGENENGRQAFSDAVPGEEATETIPE